MGRNKILSGHSNGTRTNGYRDDRLFDFKVEREELKLSNGQMTGIDALYRGDTGAYLSSVSPKYIVTTHAKANNFIEKMLNKQNIPFDIGHTSVANKGNRFFREFRFPSMKFIPSGPKSTALDGGVKDEYCPTIIARNSYDRSSTLDFLYGGFRYICTNGMVMGDVIQNISIKHNVEPDYKVIADGFLARIEATVEGFKRTYDRLNSEPAAMYIETLMMDTFSKKAALVAEALSNGLISIDVDSDGNIADIHASVNLSAYALLQISTDIATHSVRKFHRSIALQRQVSKVFGV